MPRLVLYTYEQPRGELKRCEKCGFESSSLMMIGPLCSSCGTHQKKHEKVSFERRTLESSVTRKAVEMRCWSYLGKVPPEIKALLVNRYVVTEGDLPPWCRWNFKRHNRYKGKVRQLRSQKGETEQSA